MQEEKEKLLAILIDLEVNVGENQGTLMLILLFTLKISNMKLKNIPRINEVLTKKEIEDFQKYKKFIKKLKKELS